MQKKIIYSALILLAILLQLSFLPALAGKNLPGDAVLMLVLAMAVLDGFALALNWAIVAGILVDFATYGTLGEHVIVFLLVIYVVSFFSRRLSVEVKGTGRLLFFLFVAAASLISNGLLLTFLFLENKLVKSQLQFFSSSKGFLLQIICNTVLFFLWYQVVKKIKKVV